MNSISFRTFKENPELIVGDDESHKIFSHLNEVEKLIDGEPEREITVIWANKKITIQSQDLIKNPKGAKCHFVAENYGIIKLEIPNICPFNKIIEEEESNQYLLDEQKLNQLYYENFLGFIFDGEKKLPTELRYLSSYLKMNRYFKYSFKKLYDEINRSSSDIITNNSTFHEEFHEEFFALLPSYLLSNKNFMLPFIQVLGGTAFQYASKEIQENKEIVNELIKANIRLDPKLTPLNNSSAKVSSHQTKIRQQKTEDCIIS